MSIVGATNKTYQAKTAGTYRVIVTSAIGCTAISKSTVLTVQPCARESNANLSFNTEFKINIYPNPTNDGFFIENLSFGSGMVYFRILDLSGRIIESDQVDLIHTAFRFGETLAPGIYILEAEMEGERKNFRIEKMEN